MTYKNDNYDPNYRMSGEDMRKHRRLLLAMVPLFLVLNLNIVLGDGDRHALRWFIEGSWAFYVLAIIVTLTGWNYKLMAGDQLHIVEDESAKHHRAIAMQWGLIATMVMAVVLFFIIPFAPRLDARECVVTLILTGLTAASLRFALLEKDDAEEEE